LFVLNLVPLLRATPPPVASPHCGAATLLAATPPHCSAAALITTKRYPRTERSFCWMKTAQVKRFIYTSSNAGAEKERAPFSHPFLIMHEKC
jgi:hypothetical protein